MKRVIIVARRVLFCFFLIAIIVSHAAMARPSEFNRYLAKEYHTLLQAAQRDGFSEKIRFFESKELAAREGKILPPETLEAKNIPSHILLILKQAEKSLAGLLTPAMRKDYPKDIARLQALFDCWVFEQMDGSNTERIYQCREKFYQLLHYLEQPSVMVYFKKGSAELSDDSCNKIKSIASELKKKNSYDITLNAYAQENEMKDVKTIFLAKKRGKNVKKKFLEEGLSPDNITIFAFTSIQGVDKVSENKSHRSVEIVVDF